MSKEPDSNEKPAPLDEPQKLRNQTIELDRGEELVRYRTHWWQLWYVYLCFSYTGLTRDCQDS